MLGAAPSCFRGCGFRSNTIQFQIRRSTISTENSQNEKSSSLCRSRLRVDAVVVVKLSRHTLKPGHVGHAKIQPRKAARPQRRSPPPPPPRTPPPTIAPSFTPRSSKTKLPTPTSSNSSPRAATSPSPSRAHRPRSAPTASTISSSTTSMTTPSSSAPSPISSHNSASARIPQ